MAREPQRLRRRERKNITAGVAHVNASFNNTMITITDAQGNAIAWSSAGMMGFKGSRKSTPYAAQVAADDAGKKAAEHGVRTLEVEIPAGIHDGQRIRLSGEGHAGAVGGRAGDVYVEVHVRPDSRFVREGNDVYTTVDLTITQAALGATLTVPTLEGEAELTFEPGTQPGEIRVLRGRGLPVIQGFGRGNQRVLVNVTVPRRLTEEQRRLLEEFERLAGEETYEPGEGFFDKLKSAFR